MLSEPFVLLKNYRQQQDASKSSQKKKLIPIQKKLVKKTPKSKPSVIEKDRNPQRSLIQTQQQIEPIIQIQQYSDDNINEDQYSPLLFNEFKFTLNDPYCENINLSDDAFGI
ncbi:unnamed protein product (macronuclear) [Paramecium tetraurelia]|uniref:AGC-kinase C-terminal domain-containing protein n=1 Tax=Paramecium tetraurelia TaxID=5888 RepID=A0DRR0_PARTE|nr:uncharacterized protein GSPATT00019445001 [Paramecium tetraurelia]CAK85727.1 unnamed protein product [Paramecium tetraurelia]|eukprot:XP_001453124.1 hypothetical protein (macronuclear) [Paramecium tetraurelia strain d4-2]